MILTRRLTDQTDRTSESVAKFLATAGDKVNSVKMFLSYSLITVQKFVGMAYIGGPKNGCCDSTHLGYGLFMT